LAGFGLDDQKWHTVRLTRQGRLVLIALDGKSVRSETLMSATSILKRSRYTLAAGNFLLECGSLFRMEKEEFGLLFLMDSFFALQVKVARPAIPTLPAISARSL
jgi:Laminin G domain